MYAYPVKIIESIPLEVSTGSNVEIGTYLTRQIPTGSNTIGNVNVNGVVPISLCNVEIGTYLTRQIPIGSNTIGNVNVNGVVPVSLCNVEIGTYLTRQLPVGSNTIGKVDINGILPISLCNVEIGTYLTRQLPTGSNTIGNVNVNVKNSNVSDTNPFPTKIVSPTTSKNQLKVAASEIVFFNTFQYGIETDIWDNSTQNGGSALFSSNISGVVMQVSGQSNSEVIRQTINTMRYIPGRSAELTFGIKLNNPVSGIRRRIGLYNGTDGFYFEDNGGDYACTLVNSYGSNGTPYLERVSRSNWNGDKLDGTGDSGITASGDAMQMIGFEYEWYGAGQVIFKYIIEGSARTIHTFNTGNRLPFPWSITPFLPIRLEIKNIDGVAGTNYMVQFSNSLTNQGNTTKLGIAQSLLTPLTGYNMPTARTFYPVISIRLKATALQGIVIPSSFQAFTLDNTIIFYKIIRNATIANGSWVNMTDTNSFVQYNMTSTTAITDGVNIDAGIISIGGGGSRVILDKDTQYQIGRSALGTVSDTITLAIAGYATNKDAVAALTWIEQR